MQIRGGTGDHGPLTAGEQEFVSLAQASTKAAVFAGLKLMVRVAETDELIAAAISGGERRILGALEEQLAARSEWASEQDPVAERVADLAGSQKTVNFFGMYKVLQRRDFAHELTSPGGFAQIALLYGDLSTHPDAQPESQKAAELTTLVSSLFAAS